MLVKFSILSLHRVAPYASMCVDAIKITQNFPVLPRARTSREKKEKKTHEENPVFAHAKAQLMSVQHKEIDAVVSRPPERERTMSIDQVLSELDRPVALELVDAVSGPPRDHASNRIYWSSGSSHSPSPPKARKRTKVDYKEDFEPNDSNDEDYVDRPAAKEVDYFTLFSMTYSSFL